MQNSSSCNLKCNGVFESVKARKIFINLYDKNLLMNSYERVNNVHRRTHRAIMEVMPLAHIFAFSRKPSAHGLSQAKPSAQVC